MYNLGKEIEFSNYHVNFHFHVYVTKKLVIVVPFFALKNY